MARFKFFLIGSSDAPVLDVEAANLRELNEMVSHSRFIEGNMTVPDEEGVLPGVLVATARIQFIMEAS